MSQTPGSAVLIVVLALAGLGMLVAFRGGARSGHRLARHSQEVTRMGGNLVRALGTAVFIVAVQWAVVWYTSDPRAWAEPLAQFATTTPIHPIHTHVIVRPAHELPHGRRATPSAPSTFRQSSSFRGAVWLSRISCSRVGPP